MTATSFGNNCFTDKSLDISLAALKRQDPYINNIVDVASQVALYTYNKTNEWEKTDVEGTLFIYTRLASPRHGFTIMNRLSMENLTEPITKDLDFQLQDPFLLYRNARLAIHGIWFYDKQDCQRIGQRIKTLTHQEQVLAQSQGGWLSPSRERTISPCDDKGKVGGEKSDANAVDIIQMLTKARTEYDKEKVTSEPKEIGGISVLCGNPNLIKPIPVKPNTQDSGAGEPKALPLAVLFGSQHQHLHHHTSNPVPPASVMAAHPSVARTLTYNDSVDSDRPRLPTGQVVHAGCSGEGIKPIPVEMNRTDVLPQPNQESANPAQHCPAIAMLMQGPKGAVLQTVSESPENRLCDNGVPLGHHHHHLYHHHHHHHHQQQHKHYQQQIQPDPIKTLLQTHPPASLATSFSSAAPCCSNPHLFSKLGISDSSQQQNQQLLLNLLTSQIETKQSSQTASSRLASGLPTQKQGVVSPHELLNKLQVVQQQQQQQQQSISSQDSPRTHPGLAPRFLWPNINQDTSSPLDALQSKPAPTAGQKIAVQFPRIPATVSPNLLLSPSVFTPAKACSEMQTVAQEKGKTQESFLHASAVHRPALQAERAVLSRNQLQATLLHLIQTDTSFLDSIYEAYVSFFANGCSKY